ncbi:EamA family transporter [Roseburia sp. MSJ-14]|uniref:EamA family transporter n=1 Tax=Roseburia sp. MSJ-14 TaxID=2841514 RepID=UPI001C1134B2|nr:EamA family transporter [Roseburia sp. MSJ-14]MBU5474511.1 EamA family transporter [Roseburia sp. MSJ-14]
MIYYVILIGGTVLGAVASMFFKQASEKENIIKALWDIKLYIGGVLYLASALVDIYVLRYLDYSAALPFTAITYIWTLLLAYFVLKEKISKKKIIGVGLIVLGAILVM